jgi:anti-anti-sigma factor
MDIRISNQGDSVLLNMSGRFDFNDHRVLKSTYDPILLMDGVKRIEIDMADIEYLDSSALGMLMLLRERALAVGKTVVLSRPNSTVAQILDIANFKKLFTIL